jgi:DNA-binding NtrC family response regulator
MNPLQVLVISSDSETAGWLAERLSPLHFLVSTATPGPGVVRAVREGRPQVAVIDGIHERPGTAPLEVAILKDQSPGVQIIALSGHSSEIDAAVIEQGVFCYLAGCSLEEVFRVIEAAARERIG